MAIHVANEHVDHHTDAYMRTLHGRILKTLRKENEQVSDNVLKAYFRTYALLNNKVVSRTRIVATVEAVATWLRN